MKIKRYSLSTHWTQKNESCESVNALNSWICAWSNIENTFDV